MPDSNFMERAQRPEAADEIARFLQDGSYDDFFSAWPNANIVESARQGKAALCQALVAVVRERTAGAAFPDALRNLNVVAFTRDKVAPMVRGLFHAKEEEIVLDLLARSVEFLTPESIETVLLEQTWLRTAWDLANLYLSSCDAEMLSPEARGIQPHPHTWRGECGTSRVARRTAAGADAAG